MCYASPGPRCSGHAKSKLEAKQLSVVAEASQGFAKYEQVHAEYAEALREYQATPAGISELEKTIKSDSNPKDVEVAKQALAIAKRTRADSIQAYKKKYPGRPAPTMAGEGATVEAYERPLHGARSQEAKDWSPLKVIGEVKKELKRAKDAGVFPEGVKVSLLPTDLNGNFRLTVKNLPSGLTEKERSDTLSEFRSVANVFADRWRQDNWNAPLRHATVVTR